MGLNFIVLSYLPKHSFQDILIFRRLQKDHLCWSYKYAQEFVIGQNLCSGYVVGGGGGDILYSRSMNVYSGITLPRFNKLWMLVHN